MTISNSAEGGFSLLEAIVALAILASAGLVLFASMNQSIQMAIRAEASVDGDSALRDALALMETVNPAETPSGERAMGELTMRWEASLLEPARDAMTGYLQAGLYEVGLYDVQLEIFRGESLVARGSVHRVGYRQVREPAVL